MPLDRDALLERHHLLRPAVGIGIGNGVEHAGIADEAGNMLAALQCGPQIRSQAVEQHDAALGIEQDRRGGQALQRRRDHALRGRPVADAQVQPERPQHALAWQERRADRDRQHPEHRR